MNFKTYVAGIVKFLNDHPEAGELDAIRSADDEGDYYTECWGTPYMGLWSKGQYRCLSTSCFQTEEDLKENVEWDPEDYPDGIPAVNSVLVA